ncbi:MAG: glycosyltransferase family 2 protein [Bryobacteraceae bacterium]|nr:glycosyltransferase family 2 protein [Bryobacteraceae bacterium]
MKSLTIVIPAYNEQGRLPATLEAVLAHMDGLNLDFAEVVVVNDGSRDATAQVARDAASRDARIRLVENPGNRGKGYAVRHGLREAKGEWVLFTDADLSAPIEELAKLTAAVEAKGADGAIGSRALDRSLIGVHQSPFREMSGRFFNLVMRMITGLPYRDTQCGFKLVSSKAAALLAAKQQIEGFGFDVELLYIAKKHGLKILEVPVRWNNVEGTKVSLANGLAAFLDPLAVKRNDWRGLYK